MSFQKYKSHIITCRDYKDYENDFLDLKFKGFVLKMKRI